MLIGLMQAMTLVTPTTNAAPPAKDAPAKEVPAKDAPAPTKPEAGKKSEGGR